MLHVTVRQLKVFTTVARLLSFARAAEELHLTPPAVSMQIKQLETQIGLPLFERGATEVRLTLTGEFLLVHARRMLSSLKDAEDLVAKLRRVETGRITLGMLATAKYFLPHLLAHFLRDHPGVEFSLIEGNRQQLVDLLHRNEVDLAVMGRPPQELETQAEPFGEHPLGIIASPNHPLTRLREVSPDQLGSEPFIIRETGSGARVSMEAFFRETRIRPPVLMQMASNESIKQAVMAEMGIAFLSLHTVGAELQYGMLKTLNVPGLPIIRHWHIAHRRARTPSPVAEAFRCFLLEHGKALLEERFASVAASSPVRSKPAGSKPKAAQKPGRSRRR